MWWKVIAEWVILIIQFGLAIFMFYMMAAFYTGAPLVLTRRKIIKKMLDEAGLKPGQLFIELGCAEGRVLRTAVKDYHVRGMGYEINFFLVWWGRIMAGLQHLKNIRFIVKNFWKADLSGADVIYAYLFPDTMQKLKVIFDKTGKKNLLVISRVFEIKGWENKLIKKIPEGDDWIYYYRK